MNDLTTKEIVRSIRQNAVLAGDQLLAELCNDYLLRDCKQAYLAVVSNQLSHATTEINHWGSTRGMLGRN